MGDRLRMVRKRKAYTARAGIDMFDRQTTIKFTDDDRKAAEHEADGKDLADELEETEGFRPHGIEW